MGSSRGGAKQEVAVGAGQLLCPASICVFDSNQKSLKYATRFYRRASARTSERTKVFATSGSGGGRRSVAPWRPVGRPKMRPLIELFKGGNLCAGHLSLSLSFAALASQSNHEIQFRRCSLRRQPDEELIRESRLTVGCFDAPPPAASYRFADVPSNRADKTAVCGARHAGEQIDRLLAIARFLRRICKGSTQDELVSFSQGNGEKV